ncbi:acyl carrier protein [Pseudogemmobacter sonorensis]|uniref:acyl carrier protein n=1 Tax=Pseudogemmobacter sonorensis TaxID=2989681 RepID=UPI0036C2AC9B
MVERLRTMEWLPAINVVGQEIRDIMSGILRMPPEQFDLNRSLARYGIDSLMAMEMQLEVERRFGRSLPVMTLSNEMTGARLAASLLARIRDEDEEDRDKDASPADLSQARLAQPQ